MHSHKHHEYYMPLHRWLYQRDCLSLTDSQTQKRTFVILHECPAQFFKHSIKIQVTWLASPRYEAQAHVCLPVCGAPWWVLLEHYNMAIIFHHRLCYACIWSSGIILIPKTTFVSNFVSFVASIAELAHGEKLRTQSLTQLIWCPGNRSAFASWHTGATKQQKC